MSTQSPTEIQQAMALLARIYGGFASHFALAPEEQKTFQAALQIYATMHAHLAAHPELPLRGVEQAWQALLGALHHPAPCPGTRREPLEGRRYVVFSDHHRAFPGHRHDFFGRSGNQALYCAALNRYHEAGFLLVENGDAEELLIFEPRWAPGEMQAMAGMAPDQIRDRRLDLRRRQLATILEHPANSEMVATLQTFQREGRLIRVVGNHDHDLQNEALLAVLRQHFPGAEAPCDHLLLQQEGSANPAYIVMHGHQLDLSTNALVAPYHGETDTSCLDLFLEGGDRVWRWEHDGPAAWATGQAAFRNELVGDLAASGPPHPEDLAEMFALVNDLENMERGAAPEDLTVHPARWPAGRFERLLGYRIAWEYFRAQQPLWAVMSEVWTGRRMFKFRHMDEVQQVHARWQAAFGQQEQPPVLVLGHSHEVRFRARHPASQQIWPHYINTGSAGRFENLIWGLEVDGSEQRLVSWSWDPGPTVGARPVRREWQAQQEGRHWCLRAARHPRAIPT